MKIIYIASPYAGDVKNNIEFAKQACKYVITTGNAFFCPHLLYPQVLDDNEPEERKLGLNMGKQLLLKCDELWAFGNRISQGMFEEIEFARQNNIPVKRIQSMDMVQVDNKLCMEMR
ncbi:hypothetical protein LY28_00572 [Ruminiclostridium sufflavum DSM 19573]|uniref:DUF7768 domain-containing protein n=1 Tax=Ruminiclostridium sufflavum DSM 19573 TaxID=1121337 RepID=A0A318XQ93_9FIRM|nr:DUF4406 domain-containing protein [Ruminiclostridium sufflavum]PYG89355.1 hypothetical protein LY28_00572 [Ruminiclostridium sufflavum DSM 19573]